MLRLQGFYWQLRAALSARWWMLRYDLRAAGRLLRYAFLAARGRVIVLDERESESEIRGGYRYVQLAIAPLPAEGNDD